MIKKIAIISLLILCASILAYAQTNGVQKSALKKAIIKYVDLEIETPIRVDRNTFESYFQKDVHVLTIKNVTFLDSLSKLINVLKPTSSGIKPDVRLVVQLVYSNGKHKVISMSDIAIDLDGIEMKFSSDLLALIESKIK